MIARMMAFLVLVSVAASGTPATAAASSPTLRAEAAGSGLQPSSPQKKKKGKKKAGKPHKAGKAKKKGKKQGKGVSAPAAAPHP
jgi:hypothetical protein